MTEKLEKLLHHKLVQNVLALYGVHFAKYILPLVSLPYLTRVLGPTAWGVLAIAQAYAQYVSLLVEYGFGMAATREVAHHSNDRDQLAELLAGVLGAEALLVSFAVAASFVAQRWVPIFQSHPALLWAGLFWALPQAVTPLWYFSGQERMRFTAFLDISTRTVYVAGLLVFIHSPSDVWKVLALQGVTSSFSMGLVLFLIYREIPFRFPTPSLVWQALRKGWTMFLFLSSSSLYTSANIFILGLFVSPQLVGYYAGAEKIGKLPLQLFNPIQVALYPRLSNLAHHSPNKAAQLVRYGIVVMGGVAGMMALAIILCAPLLVKILLGPGFESAIPVVQVLALLVPLIALSNTLGIQWMLPLGMDRIFNTIILSSGLLNLVLAVLLVSRYTYMGMAWAVVITEVVVTAWMYFVLRSRGLDPFTYIEKVEGDSA